MNISYTISKFNRQRKLQTFYDRLMPEESSSILNIGYSSVEHSSLDNFLEKHYPHRGQITSLGIDEPGAYQQRFPEIKVVQYDGEEFPFEDGEFDIAWSNAVIEHVGGWDKQKKFLSEINRVSKKAFVTTPNRFFPIEVHTKIPFLHYLPKTIFDRLLKYMGKVWATGDYMHLLSERDFLRLAQECHISNKSIVKNYIGPFVLDFVLIISE